MADFLFCFVHLGPSALWVKGYWPSYLGPTGILRARKWLSPDSSYFGALWHLPSTDRPSGGHCRCELFLPLHKTLWRELWELLVQSWSLHLTGLAERSQTPLWYCKGEQRTQISQLAAACLPPNEVSILVLTSWWGLHAGSSLKRELGLQARKHAACFLCCCLDQSI